MKEMTKELLKTAKNVRLNSNYLRTIKILAKKYFNTEEVRIFGSRINLNKKGGDIDIYIRTSKKENILISKIAFLRDFEKQHGEQKVDLIVETSINKDKKIYKVARNEGVRI